MNKFLFPSPIVPLTCCNNGEGEQEGSAYGDLIPITMKKYNTEEKDTEENSVTMSSTNTTNSAQPKITTASLALTTGFDFGHLVAMTIIDVFDLVGFVGCHCCQFQGLNVISGNMLVTIH